MQSDVTVTQAHVGWAESIAQHLCHSADRDAAIRLVADAFTRFEADVLARHRADAEPVAWLKPDWQNPENFDGTSPVTTHRIVGWIPLYTHPAEPAQAAEALKMALGAIHHRGGPLCSARYYSDRPCDCGATTAIETVRAALAAMGERS